MIKKLIMWMLAVLVLIIFSALASATIPTGSDSLISYYSFASEYTPAGTLIISDAGYYNATGDEDYVVNQSGQKDEAVDMILTSNIDSNIASTYMTSTSNYTVMMWVKYDAHSPGETGAIGCLDAGAGYSGWIFTSTGATDPMDLKFYDGSWQDTGDDIPLNSWTLLSVTHDSGNTMRAYMNGTEIYSFTPGDDCNDDSIDIGNGYATSNNYAVQGLVDEWGFWNVTLSPTQIDELYNSGTPLDIFGGGPATPTGDNLTITNFDQWNGTQIIWYSATVNGTVYSSNSSGIIEVDFLKNNTAQLDIIIHNSTGYLNRTYTAYSPNVSGDLTASTYQAILCLNASSKVNGEYIDADTFTIGSNTTTECFNISAGTYNVTASLTGWYDSTQSITVTALSNTTRTIQNMSYANMTIYAIDGTTNETLSGYDITLNSISTPSFGESASSVTNHSFYLINGTFNVTISLNGYATTTATANITVGGHTNYTFTLYKANSVTITILDEITNNLITDNITIRWTNNATTWENITNTGTLFLSNLTPSEYTLLFYGTNYSTRTYTITVGNLSTQFLTAYMVNSQYSTIFTIKDKDTGDVMEDVSFTMYKLVNSTWEAVESKTSDITGKVQVYYDPIGNYRFYLAQTNYEDLVFYLNPILFSTYDVFMERGDLLNYSVDYDDVSIIYSPQIFNNEENTTLNFLISSPDGLLTDYGLTVTYPGGSATSTGLNAIGEQLSVPVNITGASRWDRVTLQYNYTTTLAGTRSFTQYLSINTNATTSENTWMANKDRTFGLGLFERFLIVTIIIIFTVGIATMVGQPIPGMALGLFLFGFMAHIGFIPVWGILPSMLIGLIFLTWKSGGY